MRIRGLLHSRDVRAIAAVAGTVLVLATWMITVRTVFTPRESSSRTALWITRLVGTTSLVIGRALPQSARENFLAFTSPVMLFLECGLWLAADIAGFALFGWGTGIPLGGDFFAVRSPADVLSAVAWLSNSLLLASAVVYLVRITSAFSRRERLVCRLSAQATRSLDAEHLLADYVNADGGLARLGALLARWSDWLADVHATHLAYPALTYYRSSGDICWSEAAQIMLDCAALAEACIPGSAPPEAATLIATAERSLPQIARRIGIFLPPVAASFQGREAVPFDRTLALIRDAGAHVEKDEEYAQFSFQRLRVRYAPFTNAICERLLYRYND